MQADAIDWLVNHTGPNIMLGYGSLLSEYSRRVHSNIYCPSVFVAVRGFARGWVTRSIAEQQTYVGAWQAAGAQLNAQLIPVEFDASFAKREQDYEFVEVATEQISVLGSAEPQQLSRILEDKRLWICQSLDLQQPSQDFPVAASYLVTCLLGCMEGGGKSFVDEFFTQTDYWPRHLHNDLHAPIYPRHASFAHLDYPWLVSRLNAQGCLR